MNQGSSLFGCFSTFCGWLCGVYRGLGFYGVPKLSCPKRIDLVSFWFSDSGKRKTQKVITTSTPHGLL